MAANNMYRVGDYVYFEVSASAPYQIRRIEELNKASSGDVEAKVACFFRRRDLTTTLLTQAQRYYSIDDFESDEESDKEDQPIADHEDEKPHSHEESDSENGIKKLTLNQLQKHLLKHRELFLSRQVEMLPAKHIRGKCSVTLYNNVEPLSNYLNREDSFYYKLIYDPIQKTLQEDRGTLRIGTEYQCQIQALLKDNEKDARLTENWEKLTWQPSPPRSLNQTDFETFLTVCRAVGTYARAYDPSSLVNSKTGGQSISLVAAVASANRDITLQLTHDLIHQGDYDLTKSMHLLTPDGQPLMCKDQLDEWSPNEAQLFEEALEKYARVFSDIRADFLPWKSHQAIVEMYYFWKTTDRYVKKRRNKLAAQECKLKQVYIPNYNKPNQTVLFQNAAPSQVVAKKATSGCDSCASQQSTQWYAWGPSNIVCKLCTVCWTYWKKFGGLKTPDASTKERLEAAAAAAQKTDISPTIISATVPNGNVNINIHSRAAMKVPEGPFGGSMPLVFDHAPIGTLCQITPSFVQIARLGAPKLIKPKLLARKLGITAWSTTTGSSEDNMNYEVLLRQMLEVAKSVMQADDAKRTLILAKLKTRKVVSEDKIKILPCVARIMKLKGIEITNEETNEVVKSLKRKATEDTEETPLAKKPVIDGAE